jgi:predicted anti-sigma-YlaC factor YlaD
MTDEHARIEELLSSMQDGAATPDEVAQVQRHLATCAQCRATAAAFEQIDRQVKRYLMATPVPEMASSWRSEPLVAVAPRRRGNMGHWRVTTVGLSLIFALLFAGTALTFFTRDGQQEVTQVGNVPSAGAVAFAVTATQESTGTSFSTAASAVPAAAAAPAASAAAAGGTAPSTARSAASAAPSAAASRASASAVASAAAGVPPPLAPAATPAASAPANGTATADSSIVNPTQAFRLNTATALTICRPECDAQAQSPEVLRRVVAALDRPLPPAPPVTPSPVTIPYVTLRFTLADGQVVDIGYYLQINVLQLPQGRGLVIAPEDLVTALAGAVAPR